MNPRWFWRPDWPSDFEIACRASLMQAIERIPKGNSLSEEDKEGKALFLYSASLFGRDEELPRNRPASFKASEAELRKLASLCEKLSLHIGKMRRPAVQSFYQEGGDLFSFDNSVREVMDLARIAFSCLEAEESARGAGKKVEAAQVAETSAIVFEAVAKKRPTFTTDPHNGHVSGAWPDFLQMVFDALRIKASVAAQVRAVSEKKQTENPI